MNPHFARFSLNPRMTAGQFVSLFSYEEGPARRPCASQLLEQRKAAFHETPLKAFSRGLRSSLQDFRRDGLQGVSSAIDLLKRERSNATDGLPLCENALTSPDGLLGIARNLRSDITMAAYSRGLYLAPYCGALFWWAPSQRAVASTKKLAAAVSSNFKIICDRDFHRSFDECANDKTPPRLKWALCKLHDSGFAHNFEIFDALGRACGWGCGVAVGDVFVISFMRIVNSSTHHIVMQALAHHLRKQGFELMDCGALTPEKQNLGFEPVARSAYNARLANGLHHEKIGYWRQESEQSSRLLAA